MVFSSIVFLYYFLPCVLLLYFFAPKSCKNGVLLAASLLFYAWGEPIYVLLMLFTITAAYVLGILIEKSREIKKEKQCVLLPKLVLCFGTVFFTGIFVFFKYMDFLIENFNRFAGTSFSLWKLALPVGISFYTFQVLSYLADVYRGEVKAQKNIISFALYVSMFPQLIAGPIVRYQTVEEQIRNRKITWKDAEYGIRRFVLGLSKKVLLADELGKLCEIFRISGDKSILYYWMYAVSVCMQIYFDFSGYSDMAIGLGRIFGFDFPENFHYPYMAGSITEFWRRWHKSLGTWFRDYVYLPLGGNRGGMWKNYRNILLVWILTGLWHGASWNFVLWGLYFAVFLIAEKRWFLKRMEKRKLTAHLYVLFLIVISFVIFRADHLGQAAEDIRCLLGFGKIPAVSKEAVYYLKSYGMTMLFGMIGSTPFAADLWKKAEKICGQAAGMMKMAVIVLLLFLCTASLADGSYHPFLYFRF